MWKYLIPLIVLSAPAFSEEIEITRLEYLRTYAESERHLVYQVMVESAGFKCKKVTHSLIRGMDKSDETVFVAVRCDNGVDYLVVHGGRNNKPGQDSVITCYSAVAMMREAGLQASCWSPLT